MARDGAAISFLEAPLKFRAPGVTLALGLGIGRIVFAALNRAEVVLALVAQLVLVRPFLVRRSIRVLRGEPGPRSRAHHAYIALEVAKVIALVVLVWTALQQTT